MSKKYNAEAEKQAGRLTIGQLNPDSARYISRLKILGLLGERTVNGHNYWASGHLATIFRIKPSADQGHEHDTTPAFPILVPTHEVLGVISVLGAAVRHPHTMRQIQEVAFEPTGYYTDSELAAARREGDEVVVGAFGVAVIPASVDIA